MTLGINFLTAGGNNTDTNFGGVISGTGQLTKAGTGTLTLSVANTYTGATNINAGTLSVLGSAAVSDASAVTVASGATLVLVNDETVGSLAGAGDVDLIANTLTTGGDDTDTTFSGDITGSGNLTKTGTGFFTYSGTSTFTGATNIAGGTLVVGGDLSSSSGITVSSGATLGGSGTAPMVTVNTGGTVAPGLSPGILNTGDVSLSSSSTFAVELDGTTAGTGYDQLAVTGTVALGGSTLDVTLGFSPAPNDSFTIINNDGSDAVSSNFLGLAEGGTFTSGPFEFTISYVGGDGNDVVLTVASVSYVWDGGGGDDNWTTAANWVGDVAPTAGASLTFASGAARLTNTNDFAANTDFGSIIIAGAGYSISGNAIDLTGDINATYASGTSTLDLDFVLMADATFDVASGAILVASGDISGSFGFTKAGEGSLTVSGSNTYTGATNVDAGTMTLQGGSAIGNASAVTVASNATLELNSAEEIGSLAGSGNVALGVNSLAVGGNNSDTTFAGVISGPGTLFKDGTGNFTLSGANTYTGATIINAGILTLDGNQAIADSSSVSVGLVATLALSADETIGSLFGSGNVTLGVNSLTTGGDNTDTTFSGDISGTGDLTKTGTGNFTLLGENTYSGFTFVNAGTLTVASDGNLGTDAITLAENTTLSIDGDTDIDNSISIDGLNVLIFVSSGHSAQISGIILEVGGARDLIKVGGGNLTLSAANVYTGASEVNAGTLTLSGGVAISDGSAVTVASGAILALNSNEIIGSLAGVGSVNLGSSTLTTGGDNTDTTFAGVISGSGGLTKSGNGAFTLSGNNTYGGNTIVEAGTLVVNGVIASNSGVEVGSDATLQGNGAVSHLLNFGVVAPGTSSGILSSSDAVFESGSDLMIELGGLTVGSEYDQLDVTGEVIIEFGATLSVSFIDGFQTQAGDQFIIVNNDGTDAVLGTFQGLAEGATLIVGETLFSITYTGGTGNDIVLTALSTPSIEIVSSSNPALFGTSITYTVNLSGISGTPTGEISLTINGTTYEVPLDNGQAVISGVTDLPVGNYVVTVTYGGDLNYTMGSNTLAGGQQVIQASTTTNLAALPNPSLFGQSVTFTATVSSGVGMPTGMVEFLDGSTSLGMVALNGSGVAELDVSALTIGTHAITANYLGDGTYLVSTSSPVSQVVEKIDTLTSLT